MLDPYQLVHMAMAISGICAIVFPTTASSAEPGTSGLPLHLRDRDGSLSSIAFPADATVEDLYLAPEIPKKRQLMYFGRAMRRDDTTTLADFGVCAQSTVDVEPETDAVGLYNLVSNLVNKEGIVWFDDAFFCAEHPRDDRCTVEAICRYWTRQHIESLQGIDCYGMEAGNFFIRSIHVPGDEHFRLMGHLRLQHLPNSVQYLGFPHHAITGVNLDGLHDKSLDTLNLDHNQISVMDFAKF